MNEDLIMFLIIDQLNKVTKTKVKYAIINDHVKCCINGKETGSFPLDEVTGIKIDFIDETVTVALGDKRLVRLTPLGVEWF